MTPGQGHKRRQARRALPSRPSPAHIRTLDILLGGSPQMRSTLQIRTLRVLLRDGLIIETDGVYTLTDAGMSARTSGGNQ